MTGVGKTIHQTREIATTIAVEVEEQRTATGEISSGVQNAATEIQTVTSNISEVRDTVNEAGAAADQMNGAAVEFFEQAETPRREMDSFIAEFRSA